MRKFSHFLAIDWSGAKGERQRGIALALTHADGGPPVLVKPPPRGWARLEVLAILRDELPPDTLVGMDMGISLPFADAGAFFPDWGDSPADAPALWALIDGICHADPHLEAGSVLVEIYTSIAARSGGVGKGRTKIRNYDELNAALEQLDTPPVPASGQVDDHSADALVIAAWLRHVAQDPQYWHPAGLSVEIAQTEGWTFGAV